MEEISELSSFFRVVKNLRGVLFWQEEAEVEKELRWIKKKFQYRSVGVIPQAYSKAMEGKAAAILSKKPFLVLRMPSALAELAEFGEDAARTPPLFSSALFCASFYVSPLLLVGSAAAACTKAYALRIFQAPELSDLEKKRHLRILDYSVLDSHEATTKSAFGALEKALSLYGQREKAKAKKVLKDEISAQEALSEKDGESRFWRFKELEGDKTQETVLYFHGLTLLEKAFRSDEKVKKLRSFYASNKEILQGCLALVPAFVIKEQS